MGQGVQHFKATPFHSFFLCIIYIEPLMAAAASEIDYGYLCQCPRHDVRAEFDEGHRNHYYEDPPAIHFPRPSEMVQDCPLFLNTDEKWDSTIFRTSCYHKWLHLMQYVFDCRLPEKEEVFIIAQLVEDLMEVYSLEYKRYDFETSLVNLDYQHFRPNGENYLFTPPMYHIYCSSVIPRLIATPRGWNHVICTQMNNWIDLRRFFAFVHHRVVADVQDVVLKKCNRDLLFLVNMRKNIPNFS